MKRILLLFTIFIFIGGCKDQYEVMPKDPIKEKIDLLRADFQKQTNYNQSDSNFLFTGFKTSIDWENNKIVSDDTIYLKVNLFDQVQLLSTDSAKVSIQKLVWIKAVKLKDSWNYILLTFIPENTKRGYTGAIISKSILTDRQSTTYYLGGHRISDELIGIKVANSKKSANERKCTYGYVNGVLNYVNCEPIRTGIDNPNQGGGPIDYETVDPFGDGGGAGGDGSSEGGDIEAAVNDFNERIDDSNLPDCMKNILERLQMLKGNTVADIINKFSGYVPGYNLNFKMVNLSDISQVSGVETTVSKAGYVTINFNNNPDVVRNVTDLAVATTILHESIHAFIVAWAKDDPVNSKLAYPQLFEKYIQLSLNVDQNSLQHDIITKNFITDISISLKSYGELMGYKLNDTYYDDLAWKGLTGTKAFNKLDDETKTRITNTIKAEQYGIIKEGTSRKGTKLGC